MANVGGSAAVAQAGPVATGVRLGFLDGIRGLAALYVVLHHIWLSVWGDQFPRVTGPCWLGWLLFGHLAVAVFIVVSGFSLAIAPATNEHRLKAGAGTFLRRRAWRIIPPYWAALALTALVYGVLTQTSHSDTINVKSMVVHALLLQDVIDSDKPNGAFWSIAIEWQIYFLFPLVLLVYRRWGRGATLTLAVTGVVLAHLGSAVVSVLEPLGHVSPQFFAMFVMGAVAADAVRSPRRQRTWWLRAGVALWVLTLAAAAVTGTVRYVEQYFWVDLVVGVAMALTLAGMCDERPMAVVRFLGSRPLRVLGSFSYSTYLIHLPVLSLIGYFVLDRFDLRGLSLFLVTLVVGVPTVLLCSYLFFLVFERPFMVHRSLRQVREAVMGRRSGVRAGAVLGGGVGEGDRRAGVGADVVQHPGVHSGR